MLFSMGLIINLHEDAFLFLGMMGMEKKRDKSGWNISLFF